MKVLDSTMAICSECGKTTPAKIVEEQNKVFLVKNHCKDEKVLIEKDADFYKKFRLPMRFNRKIQKDTYIHDNCNCPAFSNFAISFLYITGKCNMKCPICFLNWMCKFRDMSKNDILKTVKKRNSKFINLSGGEPTVRQDLPEIIRNLKSQGRKVNVLSNGIRLLDKNYASLLKKNGLDYVTLSFDGFNDETYLKLRGRQFVDDKIRMINILNEVRQDIVLHPVIGKTNMHEIKNLLDYSMTMDNIKYLRLIALSGKTNYLTYPSEVYDELMKCMKKYGINESYVEEWMRLKANIVRCYGYFANRNRLTDIVWVNFPVNKTEEKAYFTVDELSKMNNFLEKPMKNFSSLKSAIKTISKFFDYTKFKHLGVGLHEIYTSTNTDLLRLRNFPEINTWSDRFTNYIAGV